MPHWMFKGSGVTRTANLILSGLVGMFLTAGHIGAVLAEVTPLPRPRPAEAGPREPLVTPATPPAPFPAPRPATPEVDFVPSGPTAAQSAEEGEVAHACRIRLSEQGVVAPDIPPLEGPGGCGAPDAVRFESVRIADGGSVELRPAPQVRCALAEALATWIRDDVAPAAVTVFGIPLRAIENFDSYSCRGRNRVSGAKISEHGRANAMDVAGVLLHDGTAVAVTDAAASRDFRERLRTSACAHFTTVLGPGSDGYHEDHVHLDLAERRSGYRICQWNIADAQSADPPLPRPRPPGAQAD